MSKVNVIILAAGQSSRLYPLTRNCPKVLIRFNNEKLLNRTIRQLYSVDLTSIRIVIGYQSFLIKEALSDFGDSIQFILNEHYASDMNSLSLHLGLQGVRGPVLIIEADVILSDECWPIIRDACAREDS